MSKEHEERSLSTADLVAATDTPAGQRSSDRVADERTRAADVRMQDERMQEPGTRESNLIDTSVQDTHPQEARMEGTRMQDTRVQDTHTQTRGQGEPLAALFPPEVAADFESRWDAVQIGFVDDPGEAVRKADELVAQVMKSLAESFANERDRIEGQLGQSDSESTENMRVALRRYRSFFQRLLSL